MEREYACIFNIPWEYLGIPLDKLEAVAGEREVRASLLAAVPATQR